MSNLLSPLLKKIYKGNTYTDPIDHSHYRKLLPYGYKNQRKNALSPGTLSLERHRLLWLYLQRETDFFCAKKSLLHIAPEQPFYKIFKKMPYLTYTTSDLNSPLAEIKADLTNLPFEEACFDIVFCNHVLEHIPDDIQAMKEIYRVMKQGGWGILQVPLNQDSEETYEDPSIKTPKERIAHFGQYDHVRIYGMDYFKRLQSVGFQVIASKFSESLTQEEVERYCVDGKELIPIVRKL